MDNHILEDSISLIKETRLDNNNLKTIFQCIGDTWSDTNSQGIIDKLIHNLSSSVQSFDIILTQIIETISISELGMLLIRLKYNAQLIEVIQDIWLERISGGNEEEIMLDIKERILALLKSVLNYKELLHDNKKILGFLKGMLHNCLESCNECSLIN